MDKINSIMKKLLILLFSLLISFNSYGQWKYIVKNSEGSAYYIELDTIKEFDGHVYFWHMADYLKPTEGMMSSQVYTQVNCGIWRYKHLSFVGFEQPMGKGKIGTMTVPEKWDYVSPGSSFADMVYYLCAYVD